MRLTRFIGLGLEFNIIRLFFKKVDISMATINQKIKFLRIKNYVFLISN